MKEAAAYLKQAAGLTCNPMASFCRAHPGASTWPGACRSASSV